MERTLPPSEPRSQKAPAACHKNVLTGWHVTLAGKMPQYGAPATYSMMSDQRCSATQTHHQTLHSTHKGLAYTTTRKPKQTARQGIV